MPAVDKSPRGRDATRQWCEAGAGQLTVPAGRPAVVDLIAGIADPPAG